MTTRTRVGVNLLWLVPGVVGGSEEYVTRLLRALSDLDPPDLDVRLFGLEELQAEHPDLGERFPLRTVPLRGRLKPLRVVGETTWLAAQVRRAHLEVVWHPGGVVPLLTGGAATVLTVHDLRPLDRPEGFSRTKVAYLRAVLPRSVRRAAVVTAPSQHVVDEIGRRFSVGADRLQVVPHGIGAGLFDEVAPSEVDRVRATYGLAGRWLLYPVITYPHKDHATLVRAFARLAATHPDVDLVLTGGAGPAEDEVAAAIAASGVAERVRRTGRVPRADVDALLDGATAVAFPSRYEGFGNGALEGLAKGTPVVASDVTSLPEVVGDGGLLVAPGDVAGWTDALGQVLDDPALAARLGAAGRSHARRFTDRAAAEALASALRAAADSGPRGSGG
ncbi:glycosyltransferase family 4 protein [Iamia sp. SCSIO 61187]|uniref:glycosyltransferase family 4 protein n=1 Tax=Iamia sp. SCSIO 61187 TaxID=2722752 RepID=UPI001C62726E|nr:glycosyltransferase family 1 protein [Iamia sp. SCSIO 61187]QYG92455.1 glycosyltransferase family 4 protein [Iamia sp. SCSIO 61187]